VRHPIALAVALTLAIGLGGAPAPAQEQEPPETRLLLQETATREVEQDVLVAVLVARHEAPAPRDAQARVNALMTDAIERARAVEAVRAASGGYRVYQRFDREGEAGDWIAEQDLQLTAADAAVLLELVGALQDEGLIVSGLNYRLSPEARRALQDELTVAAIEALRARAERVAEALDLEVLRIQEIRVGSTLDQPPVRPMMAARAEAMDAMPPPMALPDLETVSVGIEAEILLTPR
jgi:uncharacterized protein